MDAATGEHLSEGHFHRHPDFHFIYIAVGKFYYQPAAALKIYDTVNAGRIKRGHQLVNGIGEELGFFVREFIRLELVFGLALDADAHRLAQLIHLRRAALLALHAGKAHDDLSLAPATL